MAALFARQREAFAGLGRNWVYRFLQRHPELTTGRNRSYEKSRITATIPTQLIGWYAHINEVIKRHSITPQDQWNMDEIGFQLGFSQHEKVVYSSATGPPISLASGSTGWSTVLECISAAGMALSPLIIHRGKSPTMPLDS
jgi:hypothetical protein